MSLLHNVSSLLVTFPSLSTSPPSQPCARLEQNVQVWPLRTLHNDALIYIPHVSVTEVSQIEPVEEFGYLFRLCESKSLSFKIHVFPSSVLISFHHHYLWFATLNLVKITNIPLSPLRSRKLLQVHGMQLCVDLVFLVYNILFFPASWGSSFGFDLILNIPSPGFLQVAFLLKLILKQSNCIVFFSIAFDCLYKWNSFWAIHIVKDIDSPCLSR